MAGTAVSVVPETSGTASTGREGDGCLGGAGGHGVWVDDGAGAALRLLYPAPLAYARARGTESSSVAACVTWVSTAPQS
jgi:hypothetical protein